jgi:hypothetical protein
MRDFLKSTGRWLRAGWFWPLALLTLPTCGLIYNFDASGPPRPPSFDPGDPPVTGAIMCDIPKVVFGSDCLDDNTDPSEGMSLARAAIALNLGETNPIVLDFSPAATAPCDGKPRKIAFHGPFPDGLTVCLNCSQQIPTTFSGPLEACVAKCKDLIRAEQEMTDADVDAFCVLNTRLSTNFDTTCFEGFCTIGGTPIPNLADPRRTPEPLKWTDLIHTMAAGSTLSFPDSGPPPADFSAGAASEQLITTGDAWVEVAAGELGVSHVVGLRTSCNDVDTCPDMDGTLADIPLSLSLNFDNAVYVIEKGNVLAGPLPDYTPGERFRIHVVDHNNGTADISFSRLRAPCLPNQDCDDPVFYTYPVGTGPNYPLRVDATFREPNASLTGVTIMRIK